jgi:hypothetical protein
MLDITSRYRPNIRFPTFVSLPNFISRGILPLTARWLDLEFYRKGSSHMVHLMNKLWKDDQGALIASEYLFVATILVIGSVVGLTNLREAINDELTELGNALLALSQGFVISGSSGTAGSVDGSQAIDTPATLTGPTMIPPFAPSVIDVIPGS